MKAFCFWVAFLTVFSLLMTASSTESAATDKFIFITAPFASPHASNLVELRTGELMASWFGGSAEGKPDVAIWMSKRSQGKWYPPQELVREPGVACYNPVIFYAANLRLWFYYKFGPHPTSWSAGRRWSDDDSKAWSAVEHLPAGIYGPIRTKPLVMADGTIVSGSSVESYRSWACWIERSTDNGQTWMRIGPIAAPVDVSGKAETRSFGIIQPSIISLGGKRLRLYARSTEQIGRICVADSTDGGMTWTQSRPIDVPNPNSGLEAIALKDGRVVLIYNNSKVFRTPLNLAVSRDGESFSDFATIESGPGEFSYPSIIQGRDADLYFTYTWNRKRIAFGHFPLTRVPRP